MQEAHHRGESPFFFSCPYCHPHHQTLIATSTTTLTATPTATPTPTHVTTPTATLTIPSHLSITIYPSQYS